MLRKGAILALVGICLFGAAAIWRGAPRPKETPPAPQESITVTDLAGRTVTIATPVERVVLARSLCLYELAAVLGDDVAEKLVGWDSSLQTGDPDAYEKFVERFPRLEKVSVLGDVLRDTVSAEAVLALDPDLVILNTYMRDRHSKGLDRLERSGVPIIYLRFDDPLRDPQASIRLLGQVLDKEQRAENVVRWVEESLSKVLLRLQQMEGPMPSVYVEAGTQGPTSYGNTFGSNNHGRMTNWSSLLAQLRCRNIAADTVSGRYGMGVIRREYLVAADPQVIIITGAHWTSFPGSLRLGYGAKQAIAQEQLTQFTQRAGWSELDAVKAGRVYGIHTRFGSHIMSFAAAQQLAQWFYPREFEELDPIRELRAFHDRFLPIDCSGTWTVAMEDG